MLTNIAPLSCITTTVLAGVKASNCPFLLSAFVARTYASSSGIAPVSTACLLIHIPYILTIKTKYSGLYILTIQYILKTLYYVLCTRFHSFYSQLFQNGVMDQRINVKNIKTL